MDVAVWGRLPAGVRVTEHSVSHWGLRVKTQLFGDRMSLKWDYRDFSDWFQIGKGVHQGCILSPCLFNLYAEYIMRNWAGLVEA